MIEQKHMNKLKFMKTKSHIIFWFGVDKDNKEDVSTRGSVENLAMEINQRHVPERSIFQTKRS